MKPIDMRRMLAGLLILTMALCLCACGGSGSPGVYHDTRSRAGTRADPDAGAHTGPDTGTDAGAHCRRIAHG